MSPHREVKLNLIDVRTRQIIKRPDGKNMELDVIAQSDCGRTLLIEVRKRKEKATPNHAEDFLEKVKLYAEQTPDHTIIPAFYSAGGFTEKAEQFCEDNKIGTGTELTFFYGRAQSESGFMNLKQACHSYEAAGFDRHRKQTFIAKSQI